ncbi:hypothetical protein [Streptomyces corynorhini]|uniref:Uncharacterized protein n=1 Tax=Streptomyces corynorhini TaxID=2282652 RepID=A0A370B607_9ACTN|nr:hypothetical protein [Streptomyces corynorhini]RDG37031.1 hypothetical protein DVH02_16715 [Streptomyces corynorhini]
MTGSSKARGRLTRLTETVGTVGMDGLLVVPKGEYGGDNVDLVPGAVLRWPPCECGHSLCPDAPASAEE